jgi:hypothetical protein
MRPEPSKLPLSVLPRAVVARFINWSAVSRKLIQHAILKETMKLYHPQNVPKRQENSNFSSTVFTEIYHRITAVTHNITFWDIVLAHFAPLDFLRTPDLERMATTD